MILVGVRRDGPFNDIRTPRQQINADAADAEGKEPEQRRADQYVPQN
jgi:hypothetical protein